MSKFLNISTDNTLGGSSASDDTVASQKAVKDYIDAHSGGANTDLSNLTSTGKSYASGLGLPSSRYIGLTLGASGATYTAPANGYFVLVKQASAIGQYAAIYYGGNLLYTRPGTAQAASTWFGLWLPARKGDTVFVSYNLGGSTQAFTFVYAAGEN